MKRIWIILLFSPLCLHAQTEPLTLEDCIARAVEKWPGSRSASDMLAIGELRQRNAVNTWYPQMSMGGQATWQSDVTEVSLPVAMFDLPGMQKDQYRLYVDVNQVLYDGGISSVRAKMERISAAGDSLQVSIDVRKIKEMVIEFYTGILYYRKINEILNAQLERLDKRMESLQFSGTNGLVSGTDVLMFTAEVKKAEQLLSDAEMAETAALKSLSLLTGLELTPSSVLESPALPVTLSSENHRPELALFSLQGNLLSLSQDVTARTLRPRLSAFAQGGYGRPGLNMFSTEFDTYFMVGLRLNWTLYDWGQSKREMQIADLRKKNLETASENLMLTIEIQTEQQLNEMERMKNMLKKDDEMISIYRQVVSNSSSALEQGIITPVDYLEKETLLKVAEAEKARNEVRYIRAYIGYRFIKGEI